MRVRQPAVARAAVRRLQPALCDLEEMAAVGAMAAVPVALLLLARRYVRTALTFGAIREKA